MRYSTVTHPDLATLSQLKPLNSRQVKNDAGGFVFEINDWTMLDRFLILGAEGGTYYVNQEKHVKRNYDCLTRCFVADPKRAIERIAEVSVKALAVKQDHAIFALAVAAASQDAETRALALSKVKAVCRTGTTLFQFLEELKPIRAISGRSVRRTLGDWYSMPDEKLAYQLVKYRQRNGWTHRDALRLAHIKPNGNAQLLQWAVKGGSSEIPLIVGFEKLKKAENAKVAAQLVSEYGLPREAIPTQFLTDPVIWEALLPKMPLTAMIRNLGNMSKSGLLVGGSDASRTVCARLSDQDYLKASRVHPISVLMALKVYQSWRSLKGDVSWTPVPNVIATLDDAFYKAFGNVEPTGKRILVGLDVSGSMSSMMASGLSSCEAAAAMAMVWVATEPECEVMGFTSSFISLGFHRKMSLKEATQAAQRNNFGSTDCALPMVWASQNKRDFDAFIVITDNETYAGNIHPKVVLDQYRKAHVKDARQIIMGTTATNFSIADPKDPLALDIAGFSSDVPQVVASFLST